MHREGMDVAVAATIGAVLSLIVWVLMQSAGDDPADVNNDEVATSEASTSDDATSEDATSEDATPEDATSEAASANDLTPIERNDPGTVVTQPLRDQADLDAFVDAFVASRTGTYKLSGQLVIGLSGTDDTSQVLVSIVRRGSDIVEQSGTTLSVSLDGNFQSCERVFGSGLVCGEVGEVTPAESEAAALSALFDEPDPDYLLYDDQPGCWQLVATSNPAPAQWGQSTTICFDDETGAIERQTTSSGQGTRTFVAETISADVSDDDLIPPTS